MTVILVCPDCGAVKGRDPNCGWMGRYERRVIHDDGHEDIYSKVSRFEIALRAIAGGCSRPIERAVVALSDIHPDASREKDAG